jgi:hypothetical protein
MGNLATVLGTLLGAARYEFRMQIRRKALWVVIGFLGVLVFLIWYGLGSDYLHGFYTHDMGGGVVVPPVYMPASMSYAIMLWVTLIAMFLPVGVGLVLADRWVRDQRTRAQELFQTAPAVNGARIIGKYLGATLATLVPIFALYAIGIGYMLTQRADATPLAASLLWFVVLLVPSSLFVAGFSLAVPLVIKVPLYQFLFIGYWFWGNLLGPRAGIPTISQTILNASGKWAAPGLLHLSTAAGACVAPNAQVSAPLALLNIALIVGLGLLALYAGTRYQRWQWARQ